MLVLDKSVVPRILQLLFGTHAYYTDRESRLAVQKCLVAILSADVDAKALALLVAALRKESQKPGIAASSAFVLVEWCSVLMQQLAGSPLWDQFAKDILLTDAEVLEKCHQPPTKKTVSQSAVVVTRRGLRKLFSSTKNSEKRLTEAVTTLTSKSAQPASRNAILLGIIAGVSARKDHLRPVIDTLKPKYYEFFTREIVGSRTAIPEHIVLGLGDFFSSFTTLEDVSKDLVPALEKGLLRAPEVILSGVLTPLVQSLPEDLDLSTVLDGKLLKPILSNVKSTNAAIRAAAITGFRAIVAKCHEEKALNHVVDEIATPLKGGKLASPDHRTLHAQMLEAVPLSKSSAEKASVALATVAGKEGNEAALVAETAALARTVAFSLEAGDAIAKPVLDIILKGLVDKKPPSRKAWLLRTGQILHTFNQSENVSAGRTAFADAVIPKLVDTFTEVVGNAATAAQNGLIVGAYILTAMAPLIQRQFSGTSVEKSFTKAAVSKHSLSVDPKPSYLLNRRIYTRVTGEEDLRWLSRALTSISSSLNEESERSVVLAWSEAIIYLVTAPSISPRIQQEESKALSELYAHNPEVIAAIITNGLWHYLELAEKDEKDHKVDVSNLAQVLKSICLDPKEVEAYGQAIDGTVLEKQACSLLVLARPDLIPRASWIELCLRMGVDPGDLARKYQNELLKEIGSRTSIDQKVCI